MTYQITLDKVLCHGLLHTQYGKPSYSMTFVTSKVGLTTPCIQIQVDISIRSVGKACFMLWICCSPLHNQYDKPSYSVTFMTSKVCLNTPLYQIQVDTSDHTWQSLYAMDMPWSITHPIWQTVTFIDIEDIKSLPKYTVYPNTS